MTEDLQHLLAPRCPSGKRPFRSQDTAEKFADPRWSVHEAYECDHCGRWHNATRRTA